ncbi:sodium-dependent dicarboxylate transporter 2/3/5 [Sinobacterium caligoides]|uniref:Sodium-dependent dicarboxylate transporter 2/3/5 n=1 Tax=Sinobacterium caligoides TaxID=933926 RepID=A0A3N2DNB6_9GAMM|nr:SLC13 family permease [Sinobacterium caligoides]ROS01301.1 sodium-dependent dicarboxylate transporter 2/3/5 [Sinobacterium caligoides]
MDIRRWALPLGPLLALLCAFSLYATGHPLPLYVTAAVAICCVIWWLFEPIPIPVTSLLPLAVFQLFGVLSPTAIGSAYGSPLILLLLGGFILSRAMERSGAHRRLALFMTRLFGGDSSSGLLLGFMVSTAVLSMWVSNTATTLMMLPVAMAVLASSRDPKLALPLMLGIAWSASIGGMGTPVGTPPNLVFMQVYSETTGQTLGFSDWMAYGIPAVISMILVAWLWLRRDLDYRGGFELPAVGKWTVLERRVLYVFALTVLLWVTRTEPFGGWRELLDLPANDASVALLAVMAMFIIPDDKGKKLLDWQAAESIPWGILLLFGGGVCLARAFGVSGLSDMLAHYLNGLLSLPIIVAVAMIALAVTFITETTSNTASTVLLMPVLAAAAVGSDIAPEVLMVPAVLSASCAFMMPVATAPNSIVMASGQLAAGDMAKQGFMLNILGTLVITAVVWAVVTTG